MTTVPVADQPPTIHDVGPPVPRWEYPEVAALVVLVAVAVLATGGLATGLAMSLGRGVPFNRFFTGRAIELGSFWASAVLAAVLLGVLGQCWWHLSRWERQRDHSSRSIVAALHVARGRNLVTWLQAAFVLTAIAAICQLVGAIMAGGGSVTIWAPDFNTGANVLAVLVLTVTGIIFCRRLTTA
jgi:hypothetical protein